MPNFTLGPGFSVEAATQIHATLRRFPPGVLDGLHRIEIDPALEGTKDTGRHYPGQGRITLSPVVVVSPAALGHVIAHEGTHEWDVSLRGGLQYGSLAAAFTQAQLTRWSYVDRMVWNRKADPVEGPPEIMGRFLSARCNRLERDDHDAWYRAMQLVWNVDHDSVPVEATAQPVREFRYTPEDQCWIGSDVTLRQLMITTGWEWAKVGPYRLTVDQLSLARTLPRFLAVLRGWGVWGVKVPEGTVIRRGIR